jgi:hypothetical protein
MCVSYITYIEVMEGCHTQIKRINSPENGSGKVKFTFTVLNGFLKTVAKINECLANGCL